MPLRHGLSRTALPRSVSSERSARATAGCDVGSSGNRSHSHWALRSSGRDSVSSRRGGCSRRQVSSSSAMRAWSRSTCRRSHSWSSRSSRSRCSPVWVCSAAPSVGGLSPLAHVQLTMPLLASLSVIPAYLFGVKATGRRLGGFVAGLFIVLFGSFLLLTSSVSKESIGLLTFPVAVLLFLERRDPRKRALSVVLLLFLACLHPLTTLLTLGLTHALVVLAQRRAIARGRFSLRPFALDVATGPALAIPAWAYYSAVDLPFLADLLAADALVLFLGIVILLTALIAPTGRPARPRTGQRFVSPVARGILVPAIGVLVVLGNARNGLFAGAVGTQSGLLQMLPAIGVLAAFALAGYQLVRRTTNRTNDLLSPMFVAPVALILFGLLRGLDPESLVIVYRSVDFLDYAFAILIGVAFVAAWRVLGPWRPANAVLLAGLFAALLATSPIAL